MKCAPKLGSSGYVAEKTYLQPVVSGALYVGGDTFSARKTKESFILFFSRLVFWVTYVYIWPMVRQPQRNFFL